MQGVNMSVHQFSSSIFSLVQSQVQAAGVQQLQQLGAMFGQAAQVFDGLAGRLQDFLGQTFNQMPGAGWVPAPGPAVQFPINPGGEKNGLIQTGQSPPKFVTPGGYTIEAEGGSQAWKVTTPEGKSTRIWGDPHVHESDGGKWDFKKGMSFVLPDGTKITCQTTPPGPSGYTVTKSIDIMHGNERATISGIDKDKPASDGVKGDRWQVDARVPDGDYAVLGGDGDDWFLHGKSEIVGSSKAGEILHTKQGGGATGVTQKALDAMQEAPRFGSSQFMQQVLQQILQQLTGPAAFGPTGGSSPFNPGGIPYPGTGPQPGLGGWGMPGLGGGGRPEPGIGPLLGQMMETIGTMFSMLQQMTQSTLDLVQSMRHQQLGAPGGPKPTDPSGPAAGIQAQASQQFDRILETFHQDEVAGLSGKKGGADKADNMIQDLCKNPQLVKALTPEQKGRLLQILVKQTSEAHGGNQTAALSLLRSAKDPAEFKQLLSSAGGQLPLHRFFHDADQGSFNFLLEKNGVKQWHPPTFGPFFLRQFDPSMN